MADYVLIALRRKLATAEASGDKARASAIQDRIEVRLMEADEQDDVQDAPDGAEVSAAPTLRKPPRPRRRQKQAKAEVKPSKPRSRQRARPAPTPVVETEAPTPPVVEAEEVIPTPNESEEN